MGPNDLYANRRSQLVSCNTSMSRKRRRTNFERISGAVLFPCLPSRKLAQLSAERTPSLGPSPLLPGRTGGAATPHPQAPGRCLRDHLAAQLRRAPGHRHMWGCKVGREGTGLCLSVVRGAWGPETSPSGQGHDGAGAHHRLPDGRAGEPHVTEHVSKAPESPTGLETETHHKS